MSKLCGRTRSVSRVSPKPSQASGDAREAKAWQMPGPKCAQKKIKQKRKEMSKPLGPRRLFATGSSF